MATPKSLYDFYNAKGQQLAAPSLRFNDPAFAAAATAAGITKAQYIAAGSNNADYNNQILGHLVGGAGTASAPATTAPVTPTPGTPAAPKPIPPGGLSLEQQAAAKTPEQLAAAGAPTDGAPGAPAPAPGTPATGTAAPADPNAAPGSDAPGTPAIPVVPNVPNVALQPGNRGDAVKQLQDFLVSQGLMTEAQKSTGYGIYGPQTQASVAALQKNLGVDNSTGVGYFGPKTMAAIQAAGISQPQIGNTGAGAGTPTDTPTDPNAPTDTSAPTSNPMQDVIDMYTEVYAKLGLTDIKAEYTKVIEAQAKLTDDMNAEIENVTSNPWLSQGIRDKQVESIQNKYQSKIDTQTHLATLYDSLYKEGQDQAKFLIGEIQNDKAAALAAAQKKQDAIDALAKDNQIVSIGGREVLVNKQTGKTVADLGPSTSTGGTSNNVVTDNERALLTQFNGLPEVKDYKTVLSQKLTVDSILNSKLGGPGDLAVVYNFMKALDPTSVVRESEYATAAKSGNIFAGIYSQFNGYLKPEGGFLPESVKKSFQSIINSSLASKRQLYDTAAGEYKDIAKRQGLNPENVVPNYSSTQDNNTGGGGADPFADIKSSITLDQSTKKAYIPRSVWSTLGARQDALLEEAKNDGYTLLVS